jgi:uroporphyrinogen decarboxylase
MTKLFQNRPKHNGKTQVPVWFMRQAGRYHSHYQNIKKDSDFMTMCKNPKLATDITMGPIQDFGFDAAILFSDLLFPLEQLSLGLSYLSGPPTLSWNLETKNDLQKLKIIESSNTFYNFQAEALKSLKVCLPKDTTLLGFVGAPFTLYTYAVEGSHSGNLVSSKQGFYDGRFQGFVEKLYPELLTNMIIQANAGADAVCLFDTAAGELTPGDYKEFISPILASLTADFKKSCPNTKITYYSKHTGLRHLETLDLKHIDVIGVDWRQDIVEISKFFPNHFVQGNIDPTWLHLPWNILEQKLLAYFADLKNKNMNFEKWICGLGHGVLIQTPESNVRNTIKLIKENFCY